MPNGGNTSEPVDGVLELSSQGHGFLRRDPNWIPSREDLFVPNGLIRQFGLRTGQQLKVSWRPPNKGQRSSSASQVLEIEGEPPAIAKDWPSFERLTAESPSRRMQLERGPEDLSGRAIDLFAPIGFGQRGLIIAQPFAGKTTLLRNIAQSIAERYPSAERFILLVDERPEEVTDFRRADVGYVIGSSFDSGAENHLKNAELLLQRAQRLVETGKDVVMLVDSLTRLARASNLTGKQSGRTLTGGLDPAALQFPRRLFGAARATEAHGSLTIIATVLVDTGSRMDDMVYEEFKGTGNWELRLDRKLAEARLFPAIDIPATGTRREELLYTPEELAAAQRLRRFLHGQSGDRQDQLDMMLKWLKKFPTNEQIIQAISQISKQ
ncbi:MAG: transcription termination factor Rho [Armatimonadota bacterium]